jgi:hypothetical protein
LYTQLLIVKGITSEHTVGLGATELAQIDQRVRHQFHAIVPLLDTFKSEQEPLAFILPRKGPLDPHP